MSTGAALSGSEASERTPVRAALPAAAGLVAAGVASLAVSAIDAGTAVVGLASVAGVLTAQAVLVRRAGTRTREAGTMPAPPMQIAEVDTTPGPVPAASTAPLVAARIDELGPFFTLTDAQLKSIADQTSEAALGILAQLRELDGQLSVMKSRSDASHERANRISAEGQETDRKVIETIRAYMKARADEIATERVHLSQVMEQMNSLKTLTRSLDQIGSATNILSLNATIEAERAGALGAGFKVVASEIRALSQQSRAAVQEANAAIAATQSVIETTLLGASTDERRSAEAKQIEHVLNQLDAVSNSYSAIVSEHAALMADMDAEHVAIAHSVMDTFGRIQFQDVVRQQVEALVEALASLQLVLGNFSQCLAGETQGELTCGQELIARLQSRYVSAVQHTTHAVALGERARTEEARAIELF
jgi:predicted  nucleic acid-binding Zn-ribbon protein